MLRKLFRPSRLQLRPLARSRLDPFLLRIRQSLEEYAEYLDKGDPPNPEDNTPIVYSGPDTELDALSKAIPEHPKEEEYLVQRWEMLINQVENSRLAYFDNLYGTRTYYQPTLPGQERVAVDKILDRSISRNKIDRLTKRETLFEDVESRLKDVLLKKEIDIEENQLHNFQEKLLQIPSTVYDPLGRPYKDNYGYLKPSGMQQDDMGVLIRYMELENERYLLNTHKAGNNIFRSTIEDIAETNSKATFFRLAPCLGKEYLYFYSEELKSVAKVKIRDISDYLSSDNSKNLMDQLQAKGLLKQTQEQSAEEINRALRAAKASVDVSAVVSLEDLREYFFNFKDKTSFAICKYLQFNAFTSKNINFLSVDQTERFLTVTLLANDAYLTVVLDLESRKAFSHYFLDNVHPQICVQQEENGVAIYRALFHDKGIAVWRHQVDSFIACKAKEEEITSLVKYMSENQESLIDNSALFAKGEVLHSFLGAKDMEIKQRKGSIDVSCWRGDNQIDTYEIKDSKGLKPVGGSRTPFGDTSSQRYEIQLKASSTIIKRSPLAKPHWGKPSSGEVKEIKLNFPIKSAVFLDDFVGLVVHSSKSNSDELVYISDKDPEMTILSLADPSQADKIINSEITLISDMKAIGHCCLFVKQSLAGPKTLHLVNFQTGTTTPISSEQYDSFSDSEIIVEPYIKTSLLSSTFIFNNRKTQPDSPLLVWISDDSSIDSYCPTIHEALKREYIVLKVKIKPQEKVNVKTLIEEVYNLSKKIAKDKLCRHLYLYAHGSVAGLAGLSSHLRTLGIFQGAVFCNPLTDLLDLWNENKHSDLGYGDLKDEANLDQLLDDSPYHSDSFHMVSNTLFMSTDHYLGYPALKIYCRLKHFVTSGSHVFWTNLFPPGLKSDSVALAYLWSVHCSRLARRTAN